MFPFSHKNNININNNNNNAWPLRASVLPLWFFRVFFSPSCQEFFLDAATSGSLIRDLYLHPEFCKAASGHVSVVNSAVEVEFYFILRWPFYQQAYWTRVSSRQLVHRIRLKKISMKKLFLPAAVSPFFPSLTLTQYRCTLPDSASRIQHVLWWREWWSICCFYPSQFKKLVTFLFLFWWCLSALF